MSFHSIPLRAATRDVIPFHLKLKCFYPNIAYLSVNGTSGVSNTVS